jgi:LacI family transcriptional regulator
MLVRAIQTGRSMNIGVVVPPISTFSYELLRGVHDELARHDYLPIVHWQNSDKAIGPDEERIAEQEVIHHLLDRRIDGVIFLPADDWVFDLHVREVWKRDIPLVAVDRYLRKSGTDYVGTDDALGAKMAAEHLLSLGHRRVATIAGEERMGPFADRKHYFVETIKAAGGSCTVVEVNKPLMPRLGQLASELLTMNPRPTAVFLAADHYAPDFLAVARTFDLTIPRDLSIIGFADLELASYMTPPLTTIRQHPYLIGQEAARLVMRRCRGENDPKPIEMRLKPELIVRSSTTVPKA